MGIWQSDDGPWRGNSKRSGTRSFRDQQEASDWWDREVKLGYDNPDANRAPATSAAQAAEGVKEPAQQDVNQGASFGYLSPSDPSSQGQANDRTRNVYDRRGTESFADYGERAFQSALADFGPKELNPYADQNPLADSPFARWFQSQYQNTMPANAYLARILQGGDNPNFAPHMQGQMQQFLQGGRGFQDFGGASGNLKTLDQMATNAQNNNLGGLSTTQRGDLGFLNNNPAMALQMIMGQLSDSLGGFAGDYASGQLSSMADRYYDDPVGWQQQAGGSTFLNQALKRLGVL